DLSCSVVQASKSLMFTTATYVESVINSSKATSALSLSNNRGDLPHVLANSATASDRSCKPKNLGWLCPTTAFQSKSKTTSQLLPTSRRVNKGCFHGIAGPLYGVCIWHQFKTQTAKD